MSHVLPDDAVIEAMAKAMRRDDLRSQRTMLNAAIRTPEFQDWLSRQKGSAYLDGGFKAMDKMHGEKP